MPGVGVDRDAFDGFDSWILIHDAHDAELLSTRPTGAQKPSRVLPAPDQDDRAAGAYPGVVDGSAVDLREPVPELGGHHLDGGLLVPAQRVRDALHQRHRVFGFQRLGLKFSHPTMQSKYGRLSDDDVDVTDTLLDCSLQ